MRPLLFAVLLGLAAPSAAGAAPDSHANLNCFSSTQWHGWSAPGDGDFLYLRVGMNDIYRVQLSPGSHVRRSGDRFLISRPRGSDWVCSPLDLDLSLSDQLGFREPLIAEDLRKLTPVEVAAIPRHDLPS